MKKDDLSGNEEMDQSDEGTRTLAAYELRKGLTIFTPTYNRAYTLGRLYDSLTRQTERNFEWLIVDDGSTDETAGLVKKWEAEGKVPIRYFYQDNAGKMQAHNVGTREAAFDLFVCVDSDDCLDDHAVEKILSCWYEKIARSGAASVPAGIGSDQAPDSASRPVIGILDYKVTMERKEVTTGDLDALTGKRCTLFDAYNRYKMQGDTMLIYRTDVIRSHPFPRIPGEKFIPEAYLYDQLDQEGDLYVQGEGLYLCEYMADGYSADIHGVYRRNPKGYLLYLDQRLRLDQRLIDRARDTIRYVAIMLAAGERRGAIIKRALYPGLARALYPAGWVFYQKAYRK